MCPAVRQFKKLIFCNSVMACQGVHHRAHAAVRAAARPLVFSRATICSLRFVADRLRFRGAPSCCCQPQRSVQGVGASMESQPSPSKAASCSEARKVRCRFTCRLKIHQFPLCTLCCLEYCPSPNAAFPNTQLPESKCRFRWHWKARCFNWIRSSRHFPCCPSERRIRCSSQCSVQRYQSASLRCAPASTSGCHQHRAAHYEEPGDRRLRCRCMFAVCITRCIVND